MINEVILVGRLVRDVDLRKSQQNISVAGFTLACDREFKVQEGQPTADFIQCVVWRQGAEFLAKYSTKGDIVGVVGRLATRNYDDKDGKKVYVTEVICSKVRLLSYRKKDVNDVEPSVETYKPQVDEPSEYVGSGSLEFNSDDLPFY